MDTLVFVIGLLTALIILVGGFGLILSVDNRAGPVTTRTIEVGRAGSGADLLRWMYVETARLGGPPDGGWRGYVRSRYSPMARISQRRGDELLSELVAGGFLVRRNRGESGVTFDLPRTSPRFAAPAHVPYGTPPGNSEYPELTD